MKVAIIGAGQAGLYLSYLIKRRRPTADIRVFEQNPANATLASVWCSRTVRSNSCARMIPRLTARSLLPWKSDITLDLNGHVIRIDGVGFSAIGRLQLLQLLQARTRAAGIQVEYECVINSLGELRDAELIVGAGFENQRMTAYPLVDTSR